MCWNASLDIPKSKPRKYGHHNRLRKFIQIRVVQVILSIICSRSEKTHQLFSKVLPLVWFYTFTTSSGGRLRSIFFHLVFPSFFGAGGGVDEIGIVLLAGRALGSKMILTDLNDVLKSTRWSSKYRTSNKKSGRNKTVPIPVMLMKKCSWVWIWINSMKHWVSAERESTVDCCCKRDRCNTVMY